MRPTGELFQRPPDWPFLLYFAGAVNPAGFQHVKDTYFHIVMAMLRYFLSMEKKKPGPAKGTRFDDVARSPVGHRLFKTRRARKISQAELGKKVNISKRMIAHYESSEGDPSITTLKKLADALDVTVSYLVGESPMKNVSLDDARPALKKDIERLKMLPRKDQRTVSNTIAGLHAKNQLQASREHRKKR